MKLTIVGCGDAFGSGGRLQTGYHVDLGDHRFLIDCGATSIIGLNRLGIDPNAISTIFISHLHGDHFAGLVWWLLHSQHVAKRAVPLTVVGPPGIEARAMAAAEVLFPGSTKVARRYELTFLECRAGTPLTVGPVTVTAWEVSHPSGAPSHALRFDVGGKVLSFSGDTEWVDAIVDAAKGVDLFVCEVYFDDKPVRFHLNWQTVKQHLPAIGARRVIVTHMSPEMLSRVGSLGIEAAEDGLRLSI